MLCAGTARPTCALRSKVMLVKNMYILNVVVKQKILIKTQENKNRRRIVVLHTTEFHSLHATVYSFTYVRIYMY